MSDESETQPSRIPYYSMYMPLMVRTKRGSVWHASMGAYPDDDEACDECGDEGTWIVFKAAACGLYLAEGWHDIAFNRRRGMRVCKQCQPCVIDTRHDDHDLQLRKATRIMEAQVSAFVTHLGSTEVGETETEVKA